MFYLDCGHFVTYYIRIPYGFSKISQIFNFFQDFHCNVDFAFLQMAYELYGMLAGNVSSVTGENVKPAYGGDEESFLRKVVTPIYNVIKEVLSICLYLTLS
jgi:hypothetical protein